MGLPGPAASRQPVIATVIPCYRVSDHVLDVIKAIGPEVEHVIVVDDACPDGSGRHVLKHCDDARVVVLFHAVNQGVGGAVMTGYRHAMALGAEVMVKLDGDGQMDPVLIPVFARPILAGEADYTKGNRFHNIEDVRAMPLARLIGNAALSFLTKFSSGYWNLFDPANGYTAISAAVAAHLPLDKIARRYFFESDMLFRLGVMRACVIDVPMTAVYGAERSNLRIVRVLLPFLLNNLRNLGKRIIHNYFLRDFSIASLQLVFGILFVAFGGVFGVRAWQEGSATGQFASTGTVMLAALPVILGVQFLLSFIAFDIAATPIRPIQALLAGVRRWADVGSAIPVEVQAVRDQRTETG